MKINICPLLFLFISFQSCLRVASQKNGENKNDSLRKYSYLVVGIKTINSKPNFFPYGTGSFLKTERGMWFITAKHIITGINTFTKQPVPAPFDTIGIRYFKASNDSPAILQLAISDNLKKGIQNKYFYESPDFICLQIPFEIPQDIKLYSIENIILNGKSNIDTPDNVLFYGYGFDTKNESYNSLSVFPLKYFNGVFADPGHRDPGYPADDSLDFIIFPKTLPGMSGSPVFFKYSKIENEVKKEWIAYGGLAFGTDSAYNSTFIVRPKIAISQIIQPTIYNTTIQK